MRSFWGDYIFGGFVTTRRENGVERTTRTDVLGKGRPGEKVGVERTTRTEYILVWIYEKGYSSYGESAPAVDTAVYTYSRPYFLQL